MDWSFLDVFWAICIFFAWVFWFWLLVTVFSDLFRRRDVGGGAKVLWTVFVIVLPFLGTFIYLISQGTGMAERRSRPGPGLAGAVRGPGEGGGRLGRSGRGDRRRQATPRRRRDLAGGVRGHQGAGAGRLDVEATPSPRRATGVLSGPHDACGPGSRPVGAIAPPAGCSPGRRAPPGGVRTKRRSRQPARAGFEAVHEPGRRLGAALLVAPPLGPRGDVQPAQPGARKGARCSAARGPSAPCREERCACGARADRPATTRPAQLAQPVEHFHGKEGVSGSNPLLGSWTPSVVRAAE